MVSLEEAAQMALDHPDVTTGAWHGNRTWMVGRTAFAWVRPFSKADVKRFGTAPVPTGPILAVRVADLQVKAAALAAGTRGVFTIPHFENYPAVLVQLDRVAKRVLQRLLAEAWLACVPASMADGYRVHVRKKGRRK